MAVSIANMNRSMAKIIMIIAIIFGYTLNWDDAKNEMVLPLNVKCIQTGRSYEFSITHVKRWNYACLPDA